MTLEELEGAIKRFWPQLWDQLKGKNMGMLKIKRLHPDAKLPVYSSAGAACFDLFALLDEDTYGLNAAAYGIYITKDRPVTFRTGLAVEVPPGHVMMIYSRSGHGYKNGVTLANCVGVIDSDYRGEIMARLTASPLGGLVVRDRDRIAQAMIVPVARWGFFEVDQLEETARGEGGFGSTGA